MIYTVTFNPAIDYVAQLPGALVPGAVNRCAGEDYQFGGKGINVSQVLRVLGYESTALGFVAGATGRWLAEGLRAAGVQTDFISLAAGMTRINVKIKAEAETEINGRGPNIPAEAMARLHAKLDALARGDVLVLAGSIPPCLPGNTYEEILARLAGRNVRTVVDATGDLLLNVLKYRPFLIKPNHHELGEIFGQELRSDEEIADCARALQARGARNVLVSMAGAGALLLDEDGATHRVGVPQGKVVNSVGAGDSMVAGFLAGYLNSGDYAEALKRGTAAGSATAFAQGLATAAEMEALYAAL